VGARGAAGVARPHRRSHARAAQGEGTREHVGTPSLNPPA